MTSSRTVPPQILRVSTVVVGAITQVSLVRQVDGEVERLLPSLSAPPPVPPGALTLPELRAPQGRTVILAGTSTSGDGLTRNARIGTTLSRQAVMDQDTAQRRQAGWTLMTRANTALASSTTWTFQQEGQDRVGVLIIAGTSPDSGTLVSQGSR